MIFSQMKHIYTFLVWKVRKFLLQLVTAKHKTYTHRPLGNRRTVSLP